MKLLRLFFLLTLVALLPGSAHGGPVTESLEFVPQELKEWVPWVRERHPEWNCTSVSGKFECLWPGHFSLMLGEQGASFFLVAEVQKRTVLPLPGSGEILPYELSIKSKEVPDKLYGYRLFMQGGMPAVELSPGSYTITGKFQWDQRPRELSVPSTYALLEVTGAGEGMRRSGDSLIFADEVRPAQSSQFFLSVGRRIVDGSPVTIETLLDVRFSGDAQTINLGNVLVDGALPLQVESPLPFQLSADGTLAVQVRPGAYQVRINSVLPQPVHSIQAPSSSFAAWPQHEFWSWEADTEFRSVELEGVLPANPELTNLPEQWRRAALYMVKPGSVVTLKELRRGEDRQLENLLTLYREFWLQLDGENYTVRDTFQGSMFRDFRLNALPELRLESATVDDKPVLISEKDGRGFEVRSVYLNAQAVSLLEANGPLSALGWDIHNASLGGTLNLSPGWKLIHIFGTDHVSGSWLSSWTLLDIFVGLLIVIGTAKFFGPIIALVAAGALVLTHGEFLAPRMLLIHLLIGMALFQFSSEATGAWKRGLRWYVNASFFAWSLQVLTFIKLQLTEFLYPQLSAGTRYRTLLQNMFFNIEDSFLIWPPIFALGVVCYFAIIFVLGGAGFWRTLGRLLVVGIPGVFLIGVAVVSVVSGPSQSYSTGEEFLEIAPAPVAEVARDSLSAGKGVQTFKFQRAADGAPATVVPDAEPVSEGRVVQSGPAIPSWTWKDHAFSVKGPIEPSHQIRFLILTPEVSRAFSLFRPLLLGLLMVLVFLRLGIKLPKLHGPAFAAAFLPLLVMPGSVQAQTPDGALLKELEERLEKSLCTAEQCAQIESLEVQIRGQQANLTAVVHSMGKGAIVLPGPSEQLPVLKVLLNEEYAPALRRDEKGFLWVQVPGGRHQVKVTAALPQGESLTVQLPLKPFHTSFSSEDWEIEGLLPTGAVKSAIRLLPKKREPQLETRQSLTLPTWFHVERNIYVGEDTRASSTVTRAGDPERSAAVRIPLLNGERITSGDQVEDGYVVIRFPPHARSRSYESAFGEMREFSITAHETDFLSEQWRVRCSAFMSCSFSGLRPTKTTENGTHVHVWKPFPGEAVDVHAEFLPAAPGGSLTVDSLSHIVGWGSTRLDGEVAANIRVTEQRTFTIVVPSGAEVVQANILPYDGGAVVQGEHVSFLLNPGELNVIKLLYRLPSESGLVKTLPKLGFDHPVYNISLSAEPAPDRWLVWTGGVRWGPAVLFWPKLIFVGFVLLALARAQLLPLTALDALLLSLGLSTLPLIFVWVPLAWLFALKFSVPFARGIKERYRPLILTGFFGLTVAALAALYDMVRRGLIAAPPSLVAGNNSDSSLLRWYVDIATEELPEAWFVTLPMWCWRALMLCWATWLAVRLLSWLSAAGKVVRDLAAAQPSDAAEHAAEPEETM